MLGEFCNLLAVKLSQKKNSEIYRNSRIGVNFDKINT